LEQGVRSTQANGATSDPFANGAGGVLILTKAGEEIGARGVNEGTALLRIRTGW